MKRKLSAERFSFFRPLFQLRKVLIFCFIVLSVFTFGDKDALAAITFVSKSPAFDDSSGTTLLLPATNHIAGNLLVVLIKYEGTSTTLSVSDTAGNAYTGLTQANHSNNDLHTRIFYAKNITGNASNVVTVTWGAARTFRHVTVHQYSGANQGAPFDQENSGQGNSGTAMSTGNVTTMSPSEMMVAIAGEYSPQNYTAGTNWTIRTDFNPELGAGGTATEDRSVNVIGTYNATMTQSNSVEWIMSLATFKAASDMSAWWKLDDGAGTAVTDSSGNGFSGVLGVGGCSPGSGACPSWSSSGRTGSALSFDGVDDYVNLGDIDAFDGLTAMTVSVWIKAANTNAAATEIHWVGKSFCGGNTNDGPWEMLGGGFSAHIASFVVYPDGGVPSAYVAVDGVTTVDDTKWHMLAGVYDGSKIYIYVDGKLDASANLAGVALSSTSNYVDIGGDCNGHGGYYWNGLIDDVKFYTRALSPAEIRKLFQKGNAMKFDQE